MSAKKPIRVFLQSGERDLNLVWGYLATRNKEMAAALEYSDYDYKFVLISYYFFGNAPETMLLSYVL
jgi:hypothetical protein